MTDDQAGLRCQRCEATLERSAYEFRAERGSAALRCLRCALLNPPLLRRSVVIAAVVGTLILAINQGNVIVGGDLPASLYWKVPLTYCVPFVVATTSALLNSRRDIG